MRRTEWRRLSAPSGFWKTIWSERTCSVAPLLDFAGERLAVHLQPRALVGSGEAEEDASKRRLAASGLADEPEHLAGADDQRDVYKRLDVLPFLLERLGAVALPRAADYRS